MLVVRCGFEPQSCGSKPPVLPLNYPTACPRLSGVSAPWPLERKAAPLRQAVDRTRTGDFTRIFGCALPTELQRHGSRPEGSEAGREERGVETRESVSTPLIVLYLKGLAALKSAFLIFFCEIKNRLQFFRIIRPPNQVIKRYLKVVRYADKCFHGWPCLSSFVPSNCVMVKPAQFR